MINVKECGNDAVRARVIVVAPVETEIATLCDKYDIARADMDDALDADELPRVELMHNGGRLVIMRLPVFNAKGETPYHTAPYSLLFSKEAVISVSERPFPFIDVPLARGVKIREDNDLMHVLTLLHRSASEYLRYTKDIQKRTDLIQAGLKLAIHSELMVKLLSIEKSLVYFTTSLQSNVMMMEKFRTQRAAVWSWSDETEDFYEDALNEMRQAQQLAEIHSNILANLMDAFATLIDNNINRMAKFLASISFSLLIVPAAIGCVFGVNTGGVALHTNPYGFWVALSIAVAATLTAVIIFKKKKFF